MRFTCTELEELREVEKKNKRRDERLKHVRLKNFHKKEDEARADCLSARTQANQFIAELEVARRTFITDAYRCIFPIEVEALSERDAGEEGVCVCVCVIEREFIYLQTLQTTSR